MINLGLMKVSVSPLLVIIVFENGLLIQSFLARGMGDLPSGSAGGNDGGFSRRPGRFSEGAAISSGPVSIDQSRLPTCAPFTAFIGNLAFDVAESDVRTFFQMRNISAGAILNVKLPRDNVENKARGFGYVEFATIDDLTRALMSSNQFSIRNRVVRVDLSDSKAQTDREVRPAEANRNWRDGATPSAAGNRMMAPGRVMEQRETRPVSVAEASHNWRDGATASVAVNRMAAPGRVSEREPRPVSVAETSHNWRDGAKPVEKTVSHAAPVAASSSSEERRPTPHHVPVAEPVRNWRESAKPVEKASPQNEALVATTEAKPVENKFVRPTSEPSKVPSGSWRK